MKSILKDDGKMKQVDAKQKMKRTVELHPIDFLKLVIVKFVYSYTGPTANFSGDLSSKKMVAKEFENAL